MSNKTRKVLIVFIVVLLISFALVIYFRTKTKEEVLTTTVNNYYNTEFLYNNNYIKLANNINDSKKNNKDLDIHVTNDILYINYLNLSNTILNVPKNSSIYYNVLDNNCYEFAALVKSDLYYSSTCLDKDDKTSFKKISTATKSVYSPVVYKNGMFVTNDGIKSNFIIDTSIGEVKYISMKDKVLGLYNNIDKTMPYFDYICPNINADICKNLIFYVTFKNEVVYKNEKDNFIKDESGKNIVIRDIFSTFTINTFNKIDYSSLNYKQLKSYDFSYRLYVLNKDNILYYLDIDKHTNVDKLVFKKFTSKKVKSINYDNKNNIVDKVIITYEDGKIGSINSNLNTKIDLSTIYDRTSISSVK